MPCHCKLRFLEIVLRRLLLFFVWCLTSEVGFISKGFVVEEIIHFQYSLHLNHLSLLHHQAISKLYSFQNHLLSCTFIVFSLKPHRKKLRTCTFTVIWFYSSIFILIFFPHYIINLYSFQNHSFSCSFHFFPETSDRKNYGLQCIQLVILISLHQTGDFIRLLRRLESCKFYFQFKLILLISFQ